MKKDVIFDRAFSRTVRRNGWMLLEATLAAAMLALLLTMCVQMLRGATDQQRATDRRMLALQTVQNIAEQIENMPFETLNEEAVGAIKIPESAATFLKGGQLSIRLFEETEPIAKRAAIELAWRDHRGLKAGPARLTVWRHADGTRE